jgi:glutamyl-tRNA reductase
MTLYAVKGLSHIINARVTYRNAPIHILEKFAFKDLDVAYRIFLEKAQLKECVILQTCNRVEVFAVTYDGDLDKLLDAWASIIGVPQREFLKIVEASRGEDVLLHILKLASGLDSLVLGEDQVLGQVKRAFEFSNRNHYSGSYLSIIFNKAVKAGIRVRTNTNVNKGSVSVGSISVNLAEEYFDNLHNRRIMLIGSGEAASLIAKSLKQRNIDFIVTSRTFERAKSFSDTVAGKPITFENALKQLHGVDLVFVATNAPYYLLTYDRIEKAMSNRKEGIMILDLSNPRTVEESVASISKVKLVNMDQIAEIVEKNMRCRRNEIYLAERIIGMEMRTVDSTLKKKKAEPVVVSVFKNVDVIRQRELKKAYSILGNKLGPEELRVIEQFSYAIVEGIISTPMNNLKKEIELDDQRCEDLINIVAKLFKYEDK